MGAWDIGPFDNDGALDALGDLDQMEDVPGGLALTMREILAQEDYVEAPELSEAVAAACLVGARLIGSEPNMIATKWLDRHPFTVTDSLRDLALATLDRAARPDDNELYDLWDESGAVAQWLDTLAPYRQALTTKP
ncbi:DUF4259 domain-containing protein [Microtetraspora sp. NBRC 16547]|uniref:DUF4259 domain-containing protein n=1 Tax=Microtetraspora sp. NBRC 16547 TaxID=3030993 RepID=UPI0024A1420A|nr:DUF4259 domain-containing protein [Microtetraspora sp. NBRC 16547]GLW98530.1 hypothetical protein Misp02_26170 [Microtetraspora sp. NBRC 16547]